MKLEELKSFFSLYWKIEESRINDRLEFKQLNDFSSIRFFQFISALESNYEIEIKDVQEIFTFKELKEKVIF